MSAFEVASAIQKWASAKNIIVRAPASTEQRCLANCSPAYFSEEAESILRSKQITSIMFNNSDDVVSVFVGKRITAEQRAKLPDNFGLTRVTFATGHISELGGSLAQSQGATYTVLQNGESAFYACGSSISPGNMQSAGTLGAIVSDASGILYGITNNHVSGACSHSPIGLHIVAPGVADVSAISIAPFAIGTHYNVLPMHTGEQGNIDVFNNSDAALFSLNNPQFISSMQGSHFDTPTVVIDPSENMIVEKVGRTTGYTEGRIVGRELLPIRVYVSAANYGFSAWCWLPDAYVIHGASDSFSQAGDSGSLIVARQPDGSRQACGLLFAGGPDSSAPGGDKTFMLPIRPILQKFGVSLVGNHNVTPSPI